MSGGVPAVFYVAPYATDVAAAEANKIGRASLVGAFTLEGIELFHDGEVVTCCGDECGGRDRYVTGGR